MAMSKKNTFMSYGSVNKDAESSELERGTWPAVAWRQRGRSGNHLGAGAQHLVAASVSVSRARARNSSCGTSWRTLGACNIQDSARRARPIARALGEQRSDAERDCHSCHRKICDSASAARPTWLSILPSSARYVWNLFLIDCSPSNYSKSMSCWLRTASVQ